LPFPGDCGGVQLMFALGFFSCLAIILAWGLVK